MQKNLHHEVKPPWILFPQYGPGDCFWRQSGESWFYSIWQPYWQSLSRADQKNYLMRWQVPSDWHIFYFDAEFKQWLEQRDI